MTPLSRVSLVRRVAAAMMTLQLTLSALVPLSEARSERAPGPAQVEAAHTSGCAKVHQPATCITCQVTAVRARTAARVRVPLFATRVVDPESHVGFDSATREHGGEFHSRAPPAVSPA